VDGGVFRPIDYGRSGVDEADAARARELLRDGMKAFRKQDGTFIRTLKGQGR
jgi:DNA-binding winged helix-turn-helix (wHTH) protein